MNKNTRNRKQKTTVTHFQPRYIPRNLSKGKIIKKEKSEKCVGASIDSNKKKNTRTHKTIKTNHTI